MSTISVVARLNLEYYQKQAKHLLKSAKSREESALQRLIRHSPELANSVKPSLHHAQFAIAREQGFASWPRLKDFILQTKLDFQQAIAIFVEAALADGRRALELLERNPELSSAGFFCALVAGDLEKIGKVLQESPELARVKGGPRDWEPLLYVCFSIFAAKSSARADKLLEAARLLLRHGAEPNTSYIDERWPDNPLSCLYGATGINNNPALGLVLLEAGANPNDSESLYHSTEHADLACVRLLLAHGALPKGSNALKHMLDREDLQGLHLLLGAGADPNEKNDRDETALHWAVWRGRSAAIITALLDKGADINAKRQDGRTAYALAVQSGQVEIASLLEARGADKSLSALDRFMGACVTATPQELERMLAESPEILKASESERLLPDLATNHRTTAVRALLAAGLPVDARGELGGTALHWSCWKGYADLVKLLLHRGASLTIEDEQYHGTPPGWFGHGLQNCPDRSGDYAAVAQLLLAAGAKISEEDIPTGDVEIDTILRQHGLLRAS